MDEITEAREATQPIASDRRLDLQEPARPARPGSWSTPPAAAACIVGGAQVSELHCNFLINLGGATAADIEALGETVRRA